MTPQKITIVIPALNEADNLPNLLPRFQRAVEELQDLGSVVQMVIIDDGSTDNTAEIARKYKINVVSHPFNLGYSTALHTGFLFASQNKSDLLITVDADGQHNPEDISKLVKEYTNGGVDLLIGSRYLLETGYKKSILRFAGIRLFSHLVYALTKLRIHDVTSGFRVYSRRAISYLVHNFPQEYPEIEVLILLSRSGYKLKEFPLNMNQRLLGTSMHNFRTALTYPFKNLLAVTVVLLRTISHTGDMKV